MYISPKQFGVNLNNFLKTAEEGLEKGYEIYRINQFLVFKIVSMRNLHR